MNKIIEKKDKIFIKLDIHIRRMTEKNLMKKYKKFLMKYNTYKSIRKKIKSNRIYNSIIK